MKKKKWVYSFNEVSDAEKYASNWEGVRALLGGKGASLADMTRPGVPVPPFFTVTTEACNEYQKVGKFPAGMWEQELAALKEIEKKTGKKFGDPANPLLVSCRSGAKFSMPGMMDTVLNIGLTDQTAAGMVGLTGNPRFVYDSYRRLIEMFGAVVLGIPDEAFEEPLKEYKAKKNYKPDIEMTADDWKHMVSVFREVIKKHRGFDFPQDPLKQLELATEAVFKSWNGKRAIDYRRATNIPDDLGTAINIVTMVFGNMGDDSGTGVAFTRNPSTGERKMMGDYLLNAQGEDVIAGIRNADPIESLKNRMPEVYKQFMDIASRLETHYKDMQDVEFTIENRKLWILSARNAKRTPRAALRIAIDILNEGIISPQDVFSRISPDILLSLFAPFIPDNIKTIPISRGVNASPGVASGIAVFDSNSAVVLSRTGKSVILIRPFVTPNDVNGIVHSKGVITSEGGATGHAAVVCRQFGLPAVVGASSLKIDLDSGTFLLPSGNVVKTGELLTIDGNSGNIYLGKIPLKYPKVDENPYLKRYASLIWDKNVEEYIDQKFGTLWLLRDIISSGTLPKGFSSPTEYKLIDEILVNRDHHYIGFIQPPQSIIEDVLREFHWASDQDSQYMILGILYNLLRILQNEVGIGNHHLAFRPLTDPISTIVSGEELDIRLPLKTIMAKLDFKAPFQLVGLEFFGLNHFVKNFLDWANVQLWLAIRIEEAEQPFWWLDKTNPNGETIIPGSINISGYNVLLNGQILSTEAAKRFYNDLRKREYNWSWYDENNTSWQEILNALNSIQNTERPLISNILASCQSLGLLDRNMNITDVGSSLLVEQSAVKRKRISFAGRKLE